MFINLGKQQHGKKTSKQPGCELKNKTTTYTQHMYNHLKSKLIQPYHQKISPLHTHIIPTEPCSEKKPQPTPQRHNQWWVTQLTLMTESPILKQNNSPHPATTNPNPNQPTETNIGKTIQGMCPALEKNQTSKQLLTKKNSTRRRQDSPCSRLLSKPTENSSKEWMRTLSKAILTHQLQGQLHTKPPTPHTTHVYSGQYFGCSSLPHITHGH